MSHKLSKATIYKFKTQKGLDDCAEKRFYFLVLIIICTGKRIFFNCFCEMLMCSIIQKERVQVQRFFFVLL